MARSLITGIPVEPATDGSVVRFTKFGGYSYAAIRIDGTWFFTQGKMARISPRDWVDLLDWLGQANWHSLELME
ncbi:hypothetical protein PBI_SHEAKEIRA_78 [Mycobacterium phage SheaKeira]|nr:hypothetical protein PBI_SHEAKEIRA_78 [Mycobacterium phage SheaKeira]